MIAEVLAAYDGSDPARRALDLGSEMIILGSRGLGPIKRTVLGSVAQKVLSLHGTDSGCGQIDIRLMCRIDDRQGNVFADL